MCDLKITGHIHGPTKLPPHGGQLLEFTRNANLQVGSGFGDGFTYVFPVVKYSPASFQPGPVYWEGLLPKIGHQPYNFDQIWTAYSTPKQMDWTTKPSYKGTQSAASYALSQQTISQLLQLRSINSGG